MNGKDKVLVELYIPAIHETYDVFVPLWSPVYEVLDLLKKAVIALSQGQYQADGSSVLCYGAGDIVDINASVGELEIYNGSRLMLV